MSSPVVIDHKLRQDFVVIRYFGSSGIAVEPPKCSVWPVSSSGSKTYEVEIFHNRHSDSQYTSGRYHINANNLPENAPSLANVCYWSAL